MRPKMFFLVTILLVKLTVSMTAVGRQGPEGRMVIDPPPIDPDCRPPDVCATLKFYDANGEELGWVQGTKAWDKGIGRRLGTKAMKIRSVAKVEKTGTGGSYTLFKRRNHT